jgi:aryl-alcohol dehydrogenase
MRASERAACPDSASARSICHTDVAVRDQHIPSPLPIVLGHEGTGVVERVGAKVTDIAPGDHVLMHYSACGHCPNCAKGSPSYCFSHRAYNFGGTRADGSRPHRFIDKPERPLHGAYFRQSSFATHSLATRANVLKVSKDLPLEELAPLGCGVQTGAGAVMNSLRASAGSSIAVFGCGSVGLSGIMAARVVGCTTIVGVDVNPHKLEAAKQFGATHTIHVTAAGEALVDQLKAASGGGLNYALDTTGRTEILAQAFNSLRPLGVCALVGGSPPGAKVQLDMLSILLGRTVRGVIQGDSVPSVFLPQLIELYRQGRFPFQKLITYYDSLSSLNRAIDESAAPDSRILKPVVRVSKP